MLPAYTQQTSSGATSSREPGFTVMPLLPTNRGPFTTDKSFQVSNSNSQPMLLWRNEAGKAACREVCF